MYELFSILTGGKTSKKATKGKNKSQRKLDTHKRPWRVTYRNKNGEKTVKILKNGAKKDALLKQIEKNDFYIYGVNNLTDHQIQYYERKGLL